MNGGMYEYNDYFATMCRQIPGLDTLFCIVVVYRIVCCIIHVFLDTKVVIFLYTYKDLHESMSLFRSNVNYTSVFIKIVNLFKLN